MPRLTPSQKREIMRRALRERRQAGPKKGGFFSRLGRRFGPFGQLIGMVAEMFGRGQPSRRDIEDAVQVLTESGFEVRPSGGRRPGSQVAPPGPGATPPSTISPPGVAPPPITTRRPAEPERTRGVTGVPTVSGAEAFPEEGLVKTLPTRVRGAFRQIPEDIQDLSPEILLDSSNVYSVQFDYSQQLLYVTYRADASPIGYKEMESICTGKRHKVGIRPATPGTTYAYGGAGRKIDQKLFEEFVSADSPGQFVWQHLRVCGSQWQHQVPYSIVDVPPDQNVPRKATRRGYRVRSVPEIGQGRRGARRSTLPQRVR